MPSPNVYLESRRDQNIALEEIHREEERWDAVVREHYRRLAERETVYRMNRPAWIFTGCGLTVAAFLYVVKWFHLWGIR